MLPTETVDGGGDLTLTNVIGAVKICFDTRCLCQDQEVTNNATRGVDQCAGGIGAERIV